MCSKLYLFQTLQRHKVGDKCPCSALSLPSHLSGLDWKLKTCAQRGKNIKRQNDPIKFPLSPSNSYRELCHDSFQYSTNKSVRTANNIPPSTGSYCKFSISLRVLMGYACYYFGTKFEHAFKELNILILITDFDLKKVT